MHAMKHVLLEPPTPIVGEDPPYPRYAPAPLLVLAGFWRRVGAYLIDGVIVGVSSRAVERLIPNALLSLILTTAGAAAYFIIFWVKAGETPGYQGLKLRLVDVDGRRIGWGRAILRYVVMFVFLTLFGGGLFSIVLAGVAGGSAASGVLLAIGLLCCVLGALNFAMVAWNPGKQAWHDRAARTLVIRV